MDNQRYIDHILETESLTDALNDDNANWLLNWGIARLDAVLQGVTDRETADRRATALMAVMRKMNAIAGRYADKDTLSLAQDLEDYQTLVTAAFPFASGPLGQPNNSPAAAASVAEHLSGLTTREVLEYLAGTFYRLE